MTNEVNGVEAENVQEIAQPTNETEAEQVEDVNDDMETVDEEEEVDYQTSYEQLKKQNENDQKKIDRQRAALSQTYEKMQELQRQIDALGQGGQQKSELVEPDIDQFDDFESYTKALKEYERNLVKQEFEAKQAEELKAKKADEYQKMIAEKQKMFTEAENAYKAENPDYNRARKMLESKLEDFKPINPADQKGLMQYNSWANELYEAAEKIGLVETIHYFGKDNGANLEKLDGLRKLNGVELGFEMAKLASEIKSPKPVRKKDAATPKPVGKTKAVSVNADLHDGLSTDEWMKRRNKQRLAK